MMTPTTEATANVSDKAREALAGHLNSWRHKHALTMPAALQILDEYIQREAQKAKPKPAHKHRSPQPKHKSEPMPRPLLRTADDERRAQEREGRERAALERSQRPHLC